MSARAAEPTRGLGIERVILFSIFTAGLYFFYWFYLTWKQLDSETDDNHYPVWHALSLFVPIYGLLVFYRHMEVIRDTSIRAGVATNLVPRLAVALAIVSAVLDGTSTAVESAIATVALVLISIAFYIAIAAWGQSSLNRYWQWVASGRPRSEEDVAVQGGDWGGYAVDGPRLSRREIVAARAQQSRRNRPYIYAGLVILVAILVIPTVEFVQKFVIPPSRVAVRVGDTKYTRGDLVNFIRFNQRLSEDVGQSFELGSALFEAFDVITKNEIAYQRAPTLGVSVDEREVDAQVRRLIGVPGLSAEEAERPAVKSQIDEALFQHLNRVGLSENDYREILRKDIFRLKVRERLADNVPRIQPQIHLYRIILEKYETITGEQVERRLKGGDSIEDLTLEFSVDSEVRRNRGDEGWLPRGVVPQLDGLLFGTDEEGNRNLEVGELSGPVLIPDSDSYALLYIAEEVGAREVDRGPFEVLKDTALDNWLEEQRSLLTIEQNVLNNIDYAWVNRQVKFASVLGTPTPAPTGGFRIDDRGNVVPDVPGQ